MNEHEMSGLLPGMLAGAALGAMGMYLMAQDERQMKKTMRQLAHGAEKTMGDFDRMICRCGRHH